MLFGGSEMSDKIVKSEADWRSQLTPEQYRIARQQGTERAFTGEYWDTHTKGVYKCIGCGEPLFDSETKFDSGSGWPSYFQPINADAVEEHRDLTHGMIRREVHCRKCGSHLGHVFE